MNLWGDCNAVSCYFVLAIVTSQARTTPSPPHHRLLSPTSVTDRNAPQQARKQKWKNMPLPSLPNLTASEFPGTDNNAKQEGQGRREMGGHSLGTLSRDEKKILNK